MLNPQEQHMWVTMMNPWLPGDGGNSSVLVKTSGFFSVRYWCFDPLCPCDAQISAWPWDTSSPALVTHFAFALFIISGRQCHLAPWWMFCMLRRTGRLWLSGSCVQQSQNVTVLLCAASVCSERGRWFLREDIPPSSFSNQQIFTAEWCQLIQNFLFQFMYKYYNWHAALQ